MDQTEFLDAASQEKLLDCCGSDANIIVTTDIVVIHVNNNGLVIISDKEVMCLVPLGIVTVLHSLRAPLALCTDSDLAIAIRHVLDELLQETLRSALLWTCDTGGAANGETDDAQVVLVGLEVVVGGVELDEEAVWQDGHARDDVENDLANGLVNNGKVGNVGSVSKVEFKSWRVDECDLGGSNLVMFALVPEQIKLPTWLEFIPRG